MTVYAHSGGGWSLAKRIYAHNSGAWIEPQMVWAHDSGVWRKVHQVVNITTNTQNLNINTYVDSFNTPMTLVVIVAPGVVLGSSSTGTPAIFGSLPAGSILYIINQGYIVGAGGNGGPGGGGGGSNGANGGDAINLTCQCFIDNTGGVIGGGGGGGAGAATWPGHAPQCGGGGGGAGYNPGAGGAGYAGGAPGTSGTTTTGGIWQNQFHCAGGNGGNLGQPGVNSGNCDAQPGATGGSPGWAIRENGQSLTFIATGTVLGTVA